MTESRNQVANGADEQAERRRSTGGTPRDTLAERTRQLKGDARNLAGHAREARGEIQSYITQTVRERPVATLTAAAGIGYVLGGGLSSRLTLLMLGVATRFAMAVAAREMGTWATEGQLGGQSPSATRH